MAGQRELSQLSGQFNNPRATPPPSSVHLTERQRECLTRIASGETSAEIAEALGLSKRTVDHYVTHACARLRVRNRTQAVAKAIHEKLILSPAGESATPR